MDKNFHFGHTMEDVIRDINLEASKVTGIVDQKQIKVLVKGKGAKRKNSLAVKKTK